MLGVAAIVFLGILILVLLRKKKAASANPVAIREAAYKNAVAALGDIGDIAPREAAVISSLVIRKYLSIAANDPALFETHEEYLARDKALEGFSDDARRSAESGFSRLAAIKYSPASPNMNTLEVVDGSRSLLDTLHGGFKS